MTDTGYRYIIDRIKSRVIQPPELTAEQLSAWMLGFEQCQNEVLGILEELMDDGQRR